MNRLTLRHADWCRQWAQGRQRHGVCTNCPTPTGINPRTQKHYWHCTPCRIARTTYYTTRRRLAKDAAA